MKTMGKYFRTDDRELLEETYEMIIKTGFSVPPYPAGIGSLLQDLEKTSPKAKGAKPEDFADSRLVKEFGPERLYQVTRRGSVNFRSGFNACPERSEGSFSHLFDRSFEAQDARDAHIEPGTLN